MCLWDHEAGFGKTGDIKGFYLGEEFDHLLPFCNSSFIF